MPTLRAYFRMRFYDLMVRSEEKEEGVSFSDLRDFLEFQHWEREQSLKSDLPKLLREMISRLLESEDSYAEIFLLAELLTHKLAQICLSVEQADRFTTSAIYGAKGDYDILEKDLFQISDGPLREIMDALGAEQRDNPASLATGSKKGKNSTALKKFLKNNPKGLPGLAAGIAWMKDQANCANLIIRAAQQMLDDPGKQRRMLKASLRPEALDNRSAGCTESWTDERKQAQSPISARIAAGRHRDEEGKFLPNRNRMGRFFFDAVRRLSSLVTPR